MSRRQITLAIAVAALVLLIAAAFSQRWFIADLGFGPFTAKVRIGLTSHRSVQSASFDVVTP